MNIQSIPSWDDYDSWKLNIIYKNIFKIW